MWAKKTYEELQKHTTQPIIYKSVYYQDHEVTIEQTEEMSDWINKQFNTRESKL